MKEINSTLVLAAQPVRFQIAERLHTARPSTALLLIALLFLALLAPVFAVAQGIAISDDDIDRLGIRFAPVEAIDRHSGSQVAATIVNSPESSSQLTALYDGTLERWHVKTGSTVHAGTVLASIKSQQFLDIQNRWITAKTHFQQAMFEQQKDQQLFADGIIAKQRLEQSENSYQQAKFHFQAYEEKLRQAGFSKGLIQTIINEPSALGIYTISAHTEGILSQRAFNVGDYVSANHPIGTLQKSTLPWVRANIPLYLASTLQPGQELSVAGLSQSLQLKQKNLQVNPGTQTLEIWAQFNQPIELLVGQVISLVLPPTAEGILIPTSAIVHSSGDNTIYVRTREGVTARKLQLLPSGKNYVAREGIAPGDKIAVQGTALLKGIQLGLGEGE